ncbi:aminopeptidase P N-terminal domain-containing protein [Marinicella sp. W31]|uniref:aminopeptidase P N-terminal domain-containing protein n=1 Tax=Marinicella sp. W31 TaxID=3023713 RepID=UPI003757E0B3
MIKKREYQRRRRQIMKTIGEGSIAILSAREEFLRNGDAYYKYRQDSNFYYLTGFDEPEAVLVLCPGSEYGDSILFCREISDDHVMWHGDMSGTDNAVEDYGFDHAFDILQIEKRMPELISGREKLFFMTGTDEFLNQNIHRWIQLIRRRRGEKSTAPTEFVSLAHVIHDMRLYKSPDEIKCIQQSANIASEAHMNMMRLCAPELNETDLHAEYIKTLTRFRSEPSYLPIIGSGTNSCILHYNHNNKNLQNGELVLIDAGAEYDYYASDITRTIPVSGQFNSRQKDLYSVVLSAQEQAIEAVKPGNHWLDPHEAAVEVLVQGLLDLKIMQGSVEQILEEKTYTQYYMHMTGHWLGLDVHDVGDYKVDDLWVELEPGMVMTVEPGLYIGENTSAPAAWKGLGIRIEDDVQVTRDGHHVLSAKAPKKIKEIEQIMRG